jgi:hypothetical protein
MEKSRLFIAAAIVFVFIASCESDEAAFRTMIGLWVMDSGDPELLGRAGFDVKYEEKVFVVYFGMFDDDRFIPQEGPIALKKKGKFFIADSDRGSSTTIIPDENGVRVPFGFEGESSEGFHFTRR